MAALQPNPHIRTSLLSPKPATSLQPLVLIFQTRLSGSCCFYLVVTKAIGGIHPELVRFTMSACFDICSTKVTYALPFNGLEYIRITKFHIAFSFKDHLSNSNIHSANGFILERTAPDVW